MESNSNIAPNLYANAFRTAVLRLLGHERINDAYFLSCLNEAKIGLTFNRLMGLAIDPAPGGLRSASISTHWARRALDRLKRAGLAQAEKKGRVALVWTITTAGRVMIHRINDEARKVLAEDRS